MTHGCIHFSAIHFSAKKYVVSVMPFEDRDIIEMNESITISASPSP